MAVAIRLPDMGTNVEECKVLSWRIKPSEAVKRGDVLADIETDKAAAELESTLVDTPEVIVTFKPTVACVDPVFELRGQRGDLVSVTLGGRRLEPNEYAWDGHALWLDANISQAEELRMEFGNK